METSTKLVTTPISEEKSGIENIFNLFVENVPSAIILINNEGEIKVANKASEKIFEHDAGELLGKKINLLIPDGTKIFSSNKNQEEIQCLSFETIGLRKNNKTVDLEVTSSPFNCEGWVYNTLLIRDRSSYKQTQEALKESQQRHKTLLDSINGFIWEGKAFPFKFTYIDSHIEKVLGYSVERWLNESEFWRTIIHPEDSNWIIEHRDELIKKKGSYELTYRVISADGRVVWVRDTANVVLKDNDVVKLRGLIVDVTEYTHTENELFVSKQLYRDLVENANDIIYSHDLQGRITSLNEVGLRLTGYTREEALTMNMYDLIAPEHRKKVHEMMANIIAGEKESVYDVEIVKKDGEHIIVEVNTKLIYQNYQPIAVQGIARDITKRKALEAQLHQAQKMETVGRLAGGIAHDFNNLLAVIIGKADLALMKLKDSPGQLYKNIEDIRNAGEKAANMTQQILAFSRKQVLQLQVINLNSVVANMSKILNRLIGEDIELGTKLDSSLSFVKADPSQIEQIVMNLAINARDAMPKGGKLTIETKNVTLDANYSRYHFNVAPGEYVTLTVSDNGIGMSDDVVAHIFEPFYTTKELGKGTGLGLATVYGIVKQSGGYIWAYSEEGIGTTFKIYLPRVDEPGEKLSLMQKPVELIQGHETILLVEDDNAIRSTVREMLEIMGYKVFEASNGIEALTIRETVSDPIHLLITDIVMPGMNGGQLAEQFKAREKIKVLYMTGYSEEAVLRHGILECGSHLIQKPFTFELLAFKIRELLDDKCR